MSPAPAHRSRTAIVLLSRIDRRQGPRRSAELDSLRKPRRGAASTLHANERFVRRHWFDWLEMQMATRSADVAVIAGPAASRAHATPAMRRQVFVDLPRHRRVTGRAIDGERQAERRKVADQSTTAARSDGG